MTDAIRILHLEDDLVDAELVRAVLTTGGLDVEIEHVDGREAFAAALERGCAGGSDFDLILADYSLPSYDGLSALKTVQQICPRVPFILISGALGEEVAVKVLREGATDYLLKENLSRLVPAVERALNEAEVDAGRRRAEEEKGRLAAAIEQSSETVMITDSEGTIQYVNPAFEQISGYGRDEVIGENPRLLKSGGHTDEFYSQMWRKIAGGENWSGNLINRRKDGGLYEEECNINPVFDDSGKIEAYVAVKRDVTERRKAEAALAASEERFRMLYERNLAGVYRTTPAGKIIDCNLAAAHILGFSLPEDARTANVIDLYESPAERESFIRDLRERGRLSGKELTLIRPDGQRVWVILSASLVDDGSGNLIIEGSMIDRSEHRQLESQLAQVQKLEAVGELAGGIAHDFNNLLMAIMTSADLIELRSPESPASQELDTIRQTVDRGADLTKRLLAVARKQVLQLEVLDFNILVETELKMLRRMIPENIRIDFQPGKNLAPIRGDRSQLGQVLMNLLVNARDAMPDGGTITLESSAKAGEDEPGFANREMGAGLFVRFSVEDTGIGMNAVTLSRIFEPFYSTKGEAKGSGLGLAIVYGIINQHGGFLQVESAPGSGTQIDLFLPAVDEVLPAGDRTILKPATRTGSERLMVVEDEDVLRRTIVKILEGHGYTVVEAADGRIALDLFENGTVVDLVISDVIMPNLGGAALLLKVRSKFPSLPFLFSSGYADAALREALRYEEDVFFIAKPYGMSELTARVRGLLDGGEE